MIVSVSSSSPIGRLVPADVGLVEYIKVPPATACRRPALLGLIRASRRARPQEPYFTATMSTVWMLGSLASRSSAT